jgi:predicted secreted protein
MAKIKSFGVAVSVATNAIGGLTDVSVSGTDVTFVDITTHDSTGGFKEFVGGLKDGGTLELSGKYDIADTGQIYLRANPGESASCVVTLSDSSTASFTAIVGGYSITNPLDDAVDFSASLKITGAVTYAAGS